MLRRVYQSWAALRLNHRCCVCAGLDHSGRTRTSKSAQRYTVAGRDVAGQSEESTPYTLHYGWVCQAGFYPEDMNKKNQDNLLVHTNFDVSS